MRKVSKKERKEQQDSSSHQPKRRFFPSLPVGHDVRCKTNQTGGNSPPLLSVHPLALSACFPIASSLYLAVTPFSQLMSPVSNTSVSAIFSLLLALPLPSPPAKLLDQFSHAQATWDHEDEEMGKTASTAVFPCMVDAVNDMNRRIFGRI